MEYSRIKGLLLRLAYAISFIRHDETQTTSRPPPSDGSLQLGETLLSPSDPDGSSAKVSEAVANDTLYLCVGAGADVG